VLGNARLFGNAYLTDNASVFGYTHMSSSAPIKKLIKDGKVAVAVSNEWTSTWSLRSEVDPMDARFNKLFDEDNSEEAHRLCRELNLKSGRAREVELIWLPVGTKFIIVSDGYEGGEELIIHDDQDWYMT